MTPPAPLRVLLVDDEPPARERLRRLLAALPGVTVAGEAGDGFDALEMVESLAPDALFLDVQMPEAGGLDVAASLPDGGPAVVFVTAYDQYALQAFDAAAVDYLLKPVDPARLERAIERLRSRLPARLPACLPARQAAAHRAGGRASTPVAAFAPSHETTLPPPSLPGPRRLLVAERGRVTMIECDAIAWLQAADNYVEVHVAGGRVQLLRRTLEGLLDDLGAGFARVHRSRAVALAAVAGVEARARGDAVVRLRDGTRLGCSRAHRAALTLALQGTADGPARPPQHR